MKTLTILGSTGSIGRQALDVITRYHTNVRFGYLTTNTNIELLAQQVELYKPYGVAILSEEAYFRFRAISRFNGPILCGVDGICQAATWEENDIVLCALVGFAGVPPTLAAIERRIPVALANKETLVSAGKLITERAHQLDVPLLAVDSEHSAILQCVVGEDPSSIERIILTASGGPFRTFSRQQLQTVQPHEALQHPTWSMGAKITIDSATLMNKGFEVIEAHWLFNISPEKISVLVHPQSIIHSMVVFSDGSVKAQLSVPDMRLPIHYALTYPHRQKTDLPRIQWETIATLTFEQADVERFPCLQLAYEALTCGGTAPAVLNAANEIAVQAFLDHRLRLTDIPIVIEKTLAAIPVTDATSLQIIAEIDTAARQLAQEFVIQLQHA